MNGVPSCRREQSACIIPYSASPRLVHGEPICGDSEGGLAIFGVLGPLGVSAVRVHVRLAIMTILDMLRTLITLDIVMESCREFCFVCPCEILTFFTRRFLCVVPGPGIFLTFLIFLILFNFINFVVFMVFEIFAD